MAGEYLTHNPAQAIDNAVATLSPDRVLTVTDVNVEKAVFPLLKDCKVIEEAEKVVIEAGEDGKTLDSVVKIWNRLESIGATRKSLVLNIGGGVVTDLGGFAAATFKRGVGTINFPTTLLGAVDAATGGKTGINFNGLKNEIGAFHLPTKVIISPLPFRSLSPKECLSGYAEMIKTALISDRDFYLRLLEKEKIMADDKLLGESVEKCVAFKDDVVAQDPKEQGLRKILNFGHTAGHAFESHRLERKEGITHGEAVAHGILVALVLSSMLKGLDTMEIYHYRDFLRNNYGSSIIQCEDIAGVMEKMNSDKKNHVYGQPLFTLLKDIGEPEIDCSPSQSDIEEALEIYRDLAG